MVSIIINENILLRSYQVDDAQELFAAVNNSRPHLSPWFDWISRTTKPEHSLQFIQQSLHHLHTQEALALGIFYNDKIIGGIGMHHWEQTTKRAQLGYWISKEWEGKGIMHTCLTRFIDFLFERMGLNKIEIHFVPANNRSAKIAKRLGAHIEGVIRQCCIRHGQLEDIVMTGILKSEWKTLPRN